jgi:hypothetical protein
MSDIHNIITMLLKSAIFIISLIILNFQEAKSQDTTSRNTGSFRELGIIAGYNNNFGEYDAKRYHFLELGIMRSVYHSYHHYSSACAYFSNELGLNTPNFVWGPKLGGYFSVYMLVLGAETIYYTDFQGGSLRIGPYVGLGTHHFKLTTNFYLKITNKDFPVNQASLNITIRPFAIITEKID